MTVPQEWIDGCIAFYRNSHSNTNLSDLLEFVAQQWFLMDFISLELKSLPINLNKSILVNLTGNYVLQVSQRTLNHLTCANDSHVLTKNS